ncbi:MAG: molybdopterin-binding protein [Planctomycetota bacterium]
MLSVAQAFDKLLATVEPLEAVSLPLSDVLGLTLAEDVSAPEDSPPFDKSLMDGFAVRAADVANGFVSLKVVEVVTAGRVPSQPVGPGEATQIMTGAPIPEGADLVVKIEEALPDINSVHVTTKSVAPGTNILRRGTSVRAGDVVLKAGMKLNGSRIGALAELGRAAVKVHRRPIVAVLATGDELVPIDQTPGPGHIRNSNEAMLVALLQAAGAIPVPLGIARDNRDILRAMIQQGLQCDMLVLSGGVSAGTLDLVPSELTAASVREVFHKVELKPGKPVWFGVWEARPAVPSVVAATDARSESEPAEQISPGTNFSLDEFHERIQSMRRGGALHDFLRSIPFFSRLVAFKNDPVVYDELQRIDAILLAMSQWEKDHPERIDIFRARRIADDSGTTIEDVDRLIADFRRTATLLEKSAFRSVAQRMRDFREYTSSMSGEARSESAKSVESAIQTAPVEDSECLTPSKCHVFGLPGNPVSSLVCCELFVRTAIRRLMGEQPPLPRPMPARLEHDYSARADRPTYHPAKLMWSPEGAVVKLVPWHGSSDLCGTVAANAMAFLSGEAKEYRAGDVLEVIAW